MGIELTCTCGLGDAVTAAASHDRECAKRTGIAPTTPASVETNATPEGAPTTHASAKRAPQRDSMPPERASYTKKFRLPYTHKDGSTDVMKFYFTVGVYDDGRPGEVFIRADRVGTLASGALDAVAIFMSMLFQAGVPLKDVLDKIRGARFPPAGFTGDPDVPNCNSPLDLLARWLEHKFPQGGDQ